MDGQESAAFVESDGNAAVCSIFSGQVDVFNAPCAFCSAIAVFAKEVRCCAVIVDIALAQSGIGLCLGKQPTKIAFEPGDEVHAQLGLAGPFGRLGVHS